MDPRVKPGDDDISSYGGFLKMKFENYTTGGFSP
jgi:hypothetical protein